MNKNKSLCIAALLVLVVASLASAQARIAPNEQATVARVMAAHPEINTRDEGARGRVLDYVAADLNHGADRPWGRKARRADGADKNTDGLTYLRPDGLFEIYDVISGGSGRATWSGFGPFRQGENGYWSPADPVPSDPPADDAPADPQDPPAHPQPDGAAATEDLQRQQLAALLQIVAQLQQQNAALAQGLAEIKAAIAAGVRIRF